MSKRDQKISALLKPETSVLFIQELQSVLESCSSSFAVTHLKNELLSKFVSKDTDPAPVRRLRAIDKWRTVDDLNRKTNHRLWWSEAKFSFGSSEKVLSKAERIISDIIGPFEPESLFGDFSGGASTSKRLLPGILARKYTERLDTTPDAFPLFLQSLKALDGWRSHLMELNIELPQKVRGNIMFTVPKTTQIDRVACKEPDVNMFLQRAVGDHIRDRLRTRGIDLNDQSINRNLARKGSVDGSLATIDLSSASDTISTSLVARLIPHDWFKYMDAIRSRETLIDGSYYESAMFSTMGNGFTFELESLIFFALSKAIAHLKGIRGTISVYGDDLVVPSSLAPSLMQTLKWFGFKVNSKKSFHTGMFRESCGGHYYGGCDVTPFYIKRPLSTVVDLIHHLNHIRGWSIRTGEDMYNPKLYGLWLKYSRMIPKPLHGGFDLMDKLQLVSPGKQHSRVREDVIVLKSLSEELARGLYLASLRRIDGRLAPTTESESASDEISVPKVRKTLHLKKTYDYSYVFGLVKPMFYQEYGYDYIMTQQ